MPALPPSRPLRLLLPVLAVVLLVCGGAAVLRVPTSFPLLWLLPGAVAGVLAVAHAVVLRVRSWRQAAVDRLARARADAAAATARAGRAERRAAVLQSRYDALTRVCDALAGAKTPEDVVAAVGVNLGGERVDRAVLLTASGGGSALTPAAAWQAPGLDPSGPSAPLAPMSAAGGGPVVPDPGLLPIPVQAAWGRLGIHAGLFLPLAAGRPDDGPCVLLLATGATDGFPEGLVDAVRPLAPVVTLAVGRDGEPGGSAPRVEAGGTAVSPLAAGLIVPSPPSVTEPLDADPRLPGVRSRRVTR